MLVRWLHAIVCALPPHPGGPHYSPLLLPWLEPKFHRLQRKLFYCHRRRCPGRCAQATSITRSKLPTGTRKSSIGLLPWLGTLVFLARAVAFVARAALELPAAGRDGDSRAQRPY